MRRVIRRLILTLLVFAGIFASLNFALIYKINQNTHYHEREGLRNFPYPYKAMLAICSDIDETDTLGEFLEIQKFLCSSEKTTMGRGLNLEIGNSFFMFESRGYFAYFNNPNYSSVIRKLILSGYLDTLHSWGNFLDTTISARELALKCIGELKEHDCEVPIWVNHTRNFENLGQYRTALGDDKDSDYYHADMLRKYGVEYAWMGKMTGVIGQNTNLHFRNLLDFLDKQYVLLSIENLFKFYMKSCLGFLGVSKYKNYITNDLFWTSSLDDGQEIYEFIRFNNNPNGVWDGADSGGLSYALSARTLRKLMKNKGAIIIYTHLGRNSACGQYIASETIDALKNLKKEFESGNILVTTTQRLLNYFRVYNGLNWKSEIKGGKHIIRISHCADDLVGMYVPKVEDLKGLTFYVQYPELTEIFLGEKRVSNLQINPTDETGRKSISISWRPLTFPSL